MTYWRLFMLAGLLCLSAAGARAEPPEGYAFQSYGVALRQAAEQGRMVFLYFGRYGCGWCDKTNKESFAQASIRERYSAHYSLAYVDSESGRRLTLPSGERITERELGARLKVYATPVFVFMQSDGTVVFKAPGYKTAEELAQFDDYVHGGHYKKQKFMDYLGSRQ